MSGLTDAEVGILRDPCECGHEPDDHGSLCWLCAEESQEGCQATFMDLLAPRVARIVQGRQTAIVGDLGLSEGASS